MAAVARAASVEAVQADIEAGGVVDRVEALSTVFSVDRLRGAWGPQLYSMLVRRSLKPKLHGKSYPRQQAVRSSDCHLESVIAKCCICLGGARVELTGCVDVLASHVWERAVWRKEMGLIAGLKSRNVWYDMADSYVRATEDPRRGARLVGGPSHSH